MRKNIPELLVANKKGKIYSLPHIEAAGSKGSYFFRLRPDDLIKLPPGSELFILPDRLPVGYDPKKNVFLTINRNPFARKPHECFGVSAFISPGYTITYNSAYKERKGACLLPLFSYAAACFYRNDFYVAAVRVDRELRQDLRFMDISLVKRNLKRLRKLFPENRLIRHLEHCALDYG
ncbi:MAG: radical SAM protein, partial [Candidatus Omnitrophota bacterium]